MAHPRTLIERIKGALQFGIPPRVIAWHTRVPVSTIRKIAIGEIRADVKPDARVTRGFLDLLNGRS